MDSWARLSLYESTDIVKKLFQKRHNRELNTGKASEIVSALAQGREYFSSAADADLLVRPVLQYYGTLALSRGLILLLSPILREAALPPSHGLTSNGWGKSLHNQDPGSLSASVTKGTFLELINLNNFELPWVFTGPYPSRTYITRSYNLDDLPSTSFTFGDIISRVPELRAIYEKSFGKTANNYQSFIFNIANAHTDIDVFQSADGLQDESILREQFSLSAEISMRHSYTHNFVHTYGHFTFRLPHEDNGALPSNLPQFENDNYPYTSIIAPFPNGVQIPKLGRYFLLAFFLGTLSRYHPTYWLGMMRGQQKGDFIMPLIRESMRIIQENYCTLVIQALEGDH
ncbi:YaaC family protein [Pseudomonas sp. NyZ480]|uniref:YaaC family protein n=1 Tax=Pseudomonas sp. NyZ480 TaxID=3035289 RepID=UPI00240A43F5|nr:YaaC family protein [Pseudomonas sp. NyZ480]WEZ90479.1 YaaC family protein [Pseudomonas sp. NyZ480]